MNADVISLEQMNMQFSIARLMLLIAVIGIATCIFDNFGSAGIALSLVAVLSFVAVCLIVERVRNLPIVQTGLAALAAVLLGTMFHPFAGVAVFLLMIRLFVMRPQETTTEQHPLSETKSEKRDYHRATCSNDQPK